MLRRNENHVANGATDVQARHPKWLCVYGPVNWAGETLAEDRRVHSRGGQRELLRVCAIARKIIVMGQDASEIRHSNRSGCCLRAVGGVSCDNRMRAGCCGRGIQTGGADYSDCHTASGGAVDAPVHTTSCCRELLSLRRDDDRRVFGADRDGSGGTAAAATAASR